MGSFGYSSFREYQRETIEQISEAFEKGYRYVLLDAPTGSGKSGIASSFAKASGNSHIITVQKLLQDQYERDFGSDMFVMKGRTAYPCVYGEAGDTCADGPCRRRKMEAHSTCPYLIAKGNALSAPVTVHNFDSFFYQNNYGGGFGGRKLLIVDEAHNIPNKYTGFLSFTIDSRGGVVVPEAYKISDYDEFVKITKDEYEAEYNALQRQFNAVGLDKSELNRMQDLGKIIQRMRTYLFEREKEHPTEFVFDYKSNGKHGPSVTFRPVFVGPFVERWLFNYGERILLMSATILDKNMFCREVGLDPDQTCYIQVPSTFPPENRPILKKYAGSMSYKDIDRTLPKIADLIQEIVDRFPGRKGIVQTHSEKIAQYLQCSLFDNRFTYNSDYKRPQDMLVTHTKKDGSIIIASGLREGLDLYGDLSKVQIFCKIPYPSMGDKVVKRKMELIPSWYGWATTVMFVQALGRSVRSPKERAVTYILDSGFGWYYKKNRQFIPEYIKEAIRW